MEQETYEIICQECSKLFESTDQEERICPECWKKIVELENEGKGE